MKTDLKNGKVIGLSVECKSIDFNNFSFFGNLIYSSEFIENYSNSITLSFMGKIEILKDFVGVKIIQLYKDEESEKLISKFEEIETINKIILKELNSYQNLENLSLQRMTIEKDEISSYNIEKISLFSIDYNDFYNNTIIKGNIYTNKKTDIREINIFSFNVECFFNDDKILKVRNSSLNSVYELDNYESDILKEYINYYVENNTYIKDYINSKKLETYTF